ncbi:MAG: SHOCT domain-containing protein [Janthinobacterium lividum]
MGELGSGVRRRLEAVGRAHGFGPEATLCLHRALAAGGGMAQFSHPELGGLGQWAGGGMTMIGEMGNPALRRRVGALCAALAAEAGRAAPDPVGDAPDRGAAAWWPAGLGTPASSGAQGDAAYAWFPQARRLAVRHAGGVAVYDTAGHAISGLSQDGGAAPSLRLHAGGREIALSDLALAGEPGRGWTRPCVAEAPPAGEAEVPGGAAATGAVREGPGEAAGVPARIAERGDDPIVLIERLSALQARGVLTEQEFAAKKTELLARV